MNDLESDARAFLSSKLDGLDVSEVPFEAVKSCIDQAYEGGWTAYEADFTRFFAKKESTPVPMTPIQSWAKLRRHVGGRGQRWMLRPHMEIMSVEIGETECKAVLKIARVEEKSQRDVVTYGMKLIVWNKVETYWTINEIEVWDESSITELIRWGRVRTPDWVESQTAQFEECYRPGTKKSPLQGPAARLGVSRKEFHNLDKD